MGRLGATTGVLFWALAASPAAAEGGRVSIVGSIVTPTCAPALAAPSPAALRNQRGHCSPTSAAVRYDLSVEPAASALPGSQVIAYHDQYLRQAGASSTLVTQVYE